jgi:hypothetical protein
LIFPKKYFLLTSFLTVEKLANKEINKIFPDLRFARVAGFTSYLGTVYKQFFTIDDVFFSFRFSRLA